MTKSIPELDTLRVFVTQEDIDRGRKNDCRFCAVGLAFQRILPATLGSVGVHTVTLFTSSGWYWPYYSLPAEATDFIRRFDSIHQRNVKPFSFEVYLT